MATCKDVEPLEVVTYKGENEDFDRGVQFILEKLDALPTADVVEVKRGEWNDNIIGFCNVCSECGAIVERTAIKNNSGELNFCPNCGATMNGGKEE